MDDNSAHANPAPLHDPYPPGTGVVCVVAGCGSGLTDRQAARHLAGVHRVGRHESGGSGRRWQRHRVGQFQHGLPPVCIVLCTTPGGAAQRATGPTAGICLAQHSQCTHCCTNRVAVAGTAYEDPSVPRVVGEVDADLDGRGDTAESATSQPAG